MGLFKAENMGFLDTAKQYVDYLQSKRKSNQKLSREEVQDEIQKIVAKLKDKELDPVEREKIETEAENLAANKKASQLAYRIRSRVKDYVAAHESEGVTDQMVQSWILDPSNEIGQEILSGIKGPGGTAQVVGINGEPVTGWSKELWSGRADIGDTVAPEAGEPESKEPKKSIYNTSGEERKSQQRTVEKYKGRSKIAEENRKFFTAFIKKVLMQAHKSGVLKTMSVVSRGQGGRASTRDMSAYEFATTQAVKPIINAVAYSFADIAVRALVEFELLSADPSFEPDWSKFTTEADQIDNPDMDFGDSGMDFGDQGADFGNLDDEKPAADPTKIDHPMYQGVKPISPEDLKSYADQIFSKIKEQMELSGIKMLPATIKSMSKKMIKMASQNLEQSGFDDNLGQELEYYADRLQKTPEGETFKLSAKVNQAIQDTTVDIANDLMNNSEFIKTFVNFIIDNEEIKSLLRRLDPTVGDREEELQRRRIPQKRVNRFSRVQATHPRTTQPPLPDEPQMGESTLITFRKYLSK